MMLPCLVALAVLLGYIIHECQDRWGARKPYWVEDESLSREETLRRFYSMKPETTRGPSTLTPGETIERKWPDA